MIVDNAYAPSGWFYRVNCVFYDPSIYGRFLVVALVAGLVVVLRRADPLWMIALALAIGITWAGLLRRSRSRASSRSLAAVACAGGRLAPAGRRRWSLAALVARARRGARVAAGPPPARRQVVDLVCTHERPLDARHDGLKIVVHHPCSASASAASSTPTREIAHLRGKEPKAAASHTTPVTVAAETGLPGLALLLWLVATALPSASGGSAPASTGRPVSRSE